MSDNIWKLLQIEPTTDQAEIKRAYARQSRVFHPEEDPEGFLRLRKAYSLALEWAEGQAEQQVLTGEEEPEEWEEEGLRRRPAGQNPERRPQAREMLREAEEPQARDLYQDAEELQSREPDRDKGQEYEPHFVFRQSSDGPNPYRESDACRSFLAVYKKENQKNWKLWMEYITSPEFLAAAWEEEFCALIEEIVREREPEFRPGPEFIKSLYIAYCFTATDTGGYYEEKQRQFHLEQGRLTVPEPILAIAGKYPIPRKMTGNDQTMKAAFINYYHLRSLDEGSGWTDQALQSLRVVLERYVPAYIRDNYTGDRPAEFARHPLGLRLLNYFFDTADLSGECYRTVWEVLGLKQAVMGRNKLLYGRLRELCLEKYPVLSEEEPESFFELNGECTAYFGRYLDRKPEDVQLDEREAEEFLGREDLKRALRNRGYVEKNVLNYWISFMRSPAFLSRLRAMYEGDPTLPYARQALQRIEEAEESQRLFGQNKADKEAPASGEAVSMSYRPFLRYWLNTAFRDFRELKLYLQEQLPYSAEWAGRLLGPEGAPVCRRVALDGTGIKMEIEVRMHLYYVEYRANGREMFKPFLPYKEIKELGTEEFLLLLPMAIPADGEARLNGYSPDSGKLAGRLKERLAETALPPENRAKTAEYLSGELVQRFLDMANDRTGGGMDALPLRIYRETAEALYYAEWQQSQRVMCLYVEQGKEGMRRHSAEVYDFIRDETQAAALGKELLERMIAPPPIDCSCMEKLPETVYVSKPASPVRTLESEDITVKALNGLLEQFAEGELSRLEFSFAPDPWELKAQEAEGYPRKRALVFLKQGSGYCCFYFDDTKYLFFALMKGSDSIGSAGEEFVSLTHKNLPWQCVFTAVDPVRSNLREILRRASRREISLEKNPAVQMNGCAWRAAWGGVFIQNRRVKYNLAKQELGGFPLERACNSEKQPVILNQGPEVLNQHPLELERRTQDGTAAIIQVNGTGKQLFSEAVKQFFQGDVVWLRLSWDVRPDEYRKRFAPQFFEGVLARRAGKPMQSHIILRREGERYTLLCLQDFTERAEYYVADQRTYMDVEGNKYPKESFMGRIMPAYLIHKDPVPLRNRLDLLLDYMECLVPITNRFAEFAPEKPVKARDYDAIREEFAEAH